MSRVKALKSEFFYLTLMFYEKKSEELIEIIEQFIKSNSSRL